MRPWLTGSPPAAPGNAKSRRLWPLAALSFLAGLGWTPPATAQTKAPVAFESELFPLRDVRLLGGPLQKQQEMNREYLHKLDPDRLLSWFRKDAGLEAKAPPYRGWESEDPVLSGHILGFYMSGASMTVQATGDDLLRQRLLYIIDQLAEVQQANGSGYAMATPGGKQVFEEVAGGRIVIDGLPWNGFRINGRFEPTYTLSKQLIGLYQVVLATDSAKAKQVFLRMVDWFGEAVVDKLNDERLQTLLQCEHGSLHESYVDAWRLTGDGKYLAWARRLCHERMLAPLADGNVDFLTHFHANSNIPKYTGFEKIYQATGDERLHRAALNAWNDIVGRRTWIIGGNSANEHFFPPGDFAKVLNAKAGPELCNSVNMLRLTESLFTVSSSAWMMDFYERVLFNHILAAHDNQRCMAAYYTPMFPGAYRVYGDEFDSTWCCTGTGMEVPGKYGQMIYTHAPDNQSLDVNLFAPSELNWVSRQVKVRQETGFPYEGATTLTIDAPPAGAEFALQVRHPAWVAEGKMAVTLNGKPLAETSAAGSYQTLRRTWQNGDVLRVELPMQLSAEPLPGSDQYVAFLYGPIVLSGELGRTSGLKKEDFWQIEDKVPSKLVRERETPRLVAGNLADATRYVQPVDAGALRFRTTGFLPADTPLVPFFENHFQRYMVYWRRVTPEEARVEKEKLAAEARENAALDARTVDSVDVGEAGSESAHAYQGQKSANGFGAYGEEMQARWRNAGGGGWFSYQMKVGGNGPLFLRCVYWGNERGKHDFDVLVNNRVVATESLKATGKHELVTREIPLPAEAIANQTPVTVKFQARPGNTAGGLFGLRIVRGE